MTDTSSAASATSSASSLVVNGLISGINTTQVIQALLAGYQQPITDLQNQQTSLASQVSDYQTINTDMQAVQTAAQALNTTSSWNLMSATTGNPDVASATASPGAQTGSLSFSVTSLAQANMLLSSGSVSSESASVTSAASVLASTGAQAVGFSNLAAGSGLALGAHSVQVTQSSGAAQLLSNVNATTNVALGSNDTLDLSVNGQSYALTLQAGSYTPTQLAQAINTAAGTANAPISASINSSGQLELETNRQGSAATLSVTGGNALASLGLSNGQQATGTDAVVEVDGTSTTLTSLDAGDQVSLNAPSGSIVATVGSGPTNSGALIAAGTANAALVSSGNGSLSSVVDALNDSGLDLNAGAVAQASGGYRLQVAAGATGLAGAVEIDDTPFSSGPLAAMSSITNAEDAEINVGGANGYNLSSSTNTFTNVMPGTAITVTGTGSTSVTVSPNASGEATAVQNLVTTANQALSDIKSLAGYNESTKTGGALMGSATVENLQQSILAAFASAAGTSGYGSSSAVGITLSSTGTLSFSQSAFESAFNANPNKVASLFTQGGTFTPANPEYGGEVSLVYAGANTEAGTYPVTVSASATPAVDQGSTLSGGTVSTGETLSISMDSVDASYQVNPGESLADVATGLNNVFAAQGLGLSAVLNNNALSIESNGTGSAQSFSVSSNATGPGTTGLGGSVLNTPSTFTGTDIAGTINGAAATGTGDLLAAATTDPTLNGLALQITTPNISSPTTLGTFTYTPGLAAQLASIANDSSDPTSGSLSAAINGLQAESNGLNPQIQSDEALEAAQETVLSNQFAKMESTLGSLKNEGSELSSAISGLS